MIFTETLCLLTLSLHSTQEVETLGKQTDAIFGKLTDVRRQLHQNPELAGNEQRTAAVISAYLRKLGLEVKVGDFGNSVVGVLRGGHKGKTIAWRADMDALAGDFADPVSFKSSNGNSHACGHDVHVTVALGLADVLSQNRNVLHGNIVFIFQPQEETFKGAQGLVASNVLVRNGVKEIYGLHVTALPMGQLMVRPKELFSYQRRFRVKFNKEITADQIEIATKSVQNALNRAKPGTEPWNLQKIVDPLEGMASTTTIYKDYCIVDAKLDSRTEAGKTVMEGYLYESEASNLTGILAKIRGSLAMFKDKLSEVNFVQDNITVQNDRKLTEQSIQALRTGGEVVTPMYGQAPFFNDDFAYFQQKVPGVYFFLGGSNFSKGVIAMNHTPGFQVDEECMRTAVRAFSKLLISRGTTRK